MDIKKYSIPIIAAVVVIGWIAGYIYAGSVAEDKISKNIDQLIDQSFSKRESKQIKEHLTYDSGVSGLFYTPVVKDLTLDVPKGPILKVDEIVVNISNATDFEFEIDNMHIITTNMKDKDLEEFKEGSGVALDDISVDASISQDCSSSDCNTSIEFDADDLFKFGVSLELNDVDELIDFLNDEENNKKLQAKDPVALQAMMQSVSTLKGFSLSLNFDDAGMGANSPFNAKARDEFGIDSDIILESLELMISLDDKELTMSLGMDSSQMDGKASVSFVDISLNEQTSQLLSQGLNPKIGEFEFTLNNNGVDELFWKVIEKEDNKSKEQVLNKFDEEIERLENDEKRKARMAKRSEAKMMMMFTNEDDIVDAMKELKDFMDDPDSISISYDPDKPINAQNLSNKLDKGEKVDGLTISID